MRRHNTGRCFPRGTALITHPIVCACVRVFMSVCTHVSPSRAPIRGVGASASQWGCGGVGPVSGDTGQGGWQRHGSHLRRGGATAGPAAAAPQQVGRGNSMLSAEHHTLTWPLTVMICGLIYIILHRLYLRSHHIIVAENILEVRWLFNVVFTPSEGNSTRFTHDYNCICEKSL